MSELLLLIDPPLPGAQNMRRDVALLERCARGEICGAVRLYAFSPACLSLGRAQPEGDVDRNACARDRVDVVRRPSGGRAVLHRHEVTYSVVCHISDPHFGGPVLESCGRIHRAVAAGLARLGAEVSPRAVSADEAAAARARSSAADCFAEPSPHELVDQLGRKLVGSAQARHGEALLQHGSILLEPHRISSYLTRPAASPPSSSLRELLGHAVGRDRVIPAIREGFAEILGERLGAEPEPLPDHSMLC